MMEIIKGETPNGGVAAHISYLDENMRPCDKEYAVNITIQEIDEKGKMIMETWGTVKPSKFKQNYNCPDDEKGGKTGPGACGGKTKEDTGKEEKGKKIPSEAPGSEMPNGLTKESQAIYMKAKAGEPIKKKDYEKIMSELDPIIKQAKVSEVDNIFKPFQEFSVEKDTFIDKLATIHEAKSKPSDKVWAQLFNDASALEAKKSILGSQLNSLQKPSMVTGKPKIEKSDATILSQTILFSPKKEFAKEYVKNGKSELLLNDIKNDKPASYEAFFLLKPIIDKQFDNLGPAITITQKEHDEMAQNIVAMHALSNHLLEDYEGVEIPGIYFDTKYAEDTLAKATIEGAPKKEGGIDVPGFIHVTEGQMFVGEKDDIQTQYTVSIDEEEDVLYVEWQEPNGEPHNKSVDKLNFEDFANEHGFGIVKAPVDNEGDAIEAGQIFAADFGMSKDVVWKVEKIESNGNITMTNPTIKDSPKYEYTPAEFKKLDLYDPNYAYLTIAKAFEQGHVSKKDQYNIIKLQDKADGGKVPSPFADDTELDKFFELPVKDEPKPFIKTKVHIPSHNVGPMSDAKGKIQEGYGYEAKHYENFVNKCVDLVRNNKEYYDASYSYTSRGGYRYLNRMLGGKAISGEGENLINTFDKAMEDENARIDKPVVLWRGTSDNEIVRLRAETGIKKLEDAIGAIDDGPTFQSFSRGERTAYSFAKSHGGFVYELHCPAGTRALALDGATTYESEAEILVDRDTKFKIIDVLPMAYPSSDGERLFKVIAEVHSQKDINTKTSIDDIKKRIRGE